MYILFLSVQNAHQARYSSHMPWHCSGKICCPWSIRQQDFNVGSSNEFREGHFYPYLERRISGTIKLKLEFFNDTIFIIYSIPILSLFQICLGKCISCLCSYIIIIIWMDDQISKAVILLRKDLLFQSNIQGCHIPEGNVSQCLVANAGEVHPESLWGWGHG